MQIGKIDSGMLNGFISGFENFVHAPLRSVKAVPPLGTVVTKEGRALYQSAGGGAGFGDVTLVAKAALREGVAARVAVNVSGASAFTEGNFAGAGLTASRTLAPVACPSRRRASHRHSRPHKRVGSASAPRRSGVFGRTGNPVGPRLVDEPPVGRQHDAV